MTHKKVNYKIHRWIPVVTSLAWFGLLGKTSVAKPSMTKPCQLQVYTYQTFISKWGAGPAIKTSFERAHNCTIQWVVSDDAMSLYSRLLLEGKSLGADVVVGLDSLLLSEIKKTGLFVPYRPKQSEKIIKAATFARDAVLIPYSLGYFAIMYDTRKIKPHASWKELLADPAANKKLIVEDPRTSSVGFGWLVWLQRIFPKTIAEELKRLQAKVLTTTKGWSEAYGLFLKGEAPMVLSYTLSEAYHLAELKDKSPYRYMEFSEGHLTQIETMGLLKNSKNPEVARQFIDHMLEPTTQQHIASLGWVYPVVEGVGLSASSKQVRIPQGIITATVEDFPINFRVAWTRQWIDLVSQK